MTAPNASPVIGYAFWRVSQPDPAKLDRAFAVRLHADGTTSPLPPRPDLACDEHDFWWGDTGLAACHLAAAMLADADGDDAAQRHDVAFAQWLHSTDDGEATQCLDRTEITEWLHQIADLDTVQVADDSLQEEIDDPDWGDEEPRGGVSWR